MATKPDDMVKTMIQNLEEKTGKSISDWIKIVKSSQHEKHGQIVKFLKADHGMTHGYANLVAHQSLNTGSMNASSDDDLVADQYSGEKSALKSIYDKCISEIRKFGEDVEIAPKKAYVSVRRKKQFAIIQPTTKTRIDLGINLKGTEPTIRLESSGSFNAMVSHRVRVTNEKDIDSELLNWLKKAYESAS